MTGADIIRLLKLQPHPEGGHFRETFRDAPLPNSSSLAGKSWEGAGRAASTAIYFLLARGERSHWHRIDSVEIWHWHAGAPLDLEIVNKAGGIDRVALGSDLVGGQRPQAIVPPHAWQAAESRGDWTLCGCTVAPGFDFKSFQLAPPGWTP